MSSEGVSDKVVNLVVVCLINHIRQGTTHFITTLPHHHRIDIDRELIDSCLSA